METIDDLDWEFTFRKHKNQSIKDVLESNPSCSSSGFGINTWKGKKIIVSESLISYLEWAENKNIVNVLPKVWEEIKTYDNLYINIQSYENGSKEITNDFYDEYVKKIKEFKK